MNIKIKKGLNLQLSGAISNIAKAAQTSSAPAAATCAVCPGDFPGFKPKTLVKEGDSVLAGQPLLFDKDNESLTLVSPVSGTVKAVVRGDRRKILRVEVTPAEAAPASAPTAPLEGKDARATVEILGRAGLLAAFRQRPYDIVPTAGVSSVRDIYVSAFDIAPLAVSSLLISCDKDTVSRLTAAAEVLRRLTTGKVYLALNSDVAAALQAAGAREIPGTVTLLVDGPYPACLPGSIIAATNPINKGETVWTLDVNTMLRLGSFALTGSYSFENFVAVTGSEVREPRIVRALDGTDLKTILQDNLKNDGAHKRIISGNVFTGIREDLDGYLRFPYTQVTVIPEGDDVAEFMGWASLSPSKVSTRRSFPLSFLKKNFTPDARLNGGRRAMIMSGEYERYMPLDILPEYLLKAIMAKDIDNMERLGIYEVAPEDFALAEFADTSKLPLQQIVRDGLDYLRKELE